MKLWQSLFLAALLVTLLVMGGCTTQSKINSDEVIYIVKQKQMAHDMFIPLEGHWAAEYEGQGVWVVGMYCDKYEENYPPGWFDKSNIETAAKYGYYAHNTPYLWRYYERSNGVESILGINEMIEISKEHPKLFEGLVIYTE